MFVVERQEFALFLFRSLLLGAVLAAVYLLFGFLRIPLKRIFGGIKGGVLLVAVDLFYCFLAAFSNILMIYISNRGQVRISALLFEIAGFCLVYLPLEKWIEKAEVKILSFVKNRMVSPVCLFISKKMKGFWTRGKRSYRQFRLKRYNQQLDRMLKKAAEDAIKKGEELIFPEK